MTTQESVYIIIDPFNSYAHELMQWAFLDFGLRAVILIEDIHGAIYKKLYSPQISSIWIAESLLCSRENAAKVAEKISRRYEVKGIIPWSETTLELAIDLMRRLDIRWINPEVLSLFRNKYKLKNYLRREHPSIPMNLSWAVSDQSEVLKIKDLWPERFVIKPLDGMSNKKIGFFSSQTSTSDLSKYFSESGTGLYVLEEFIEGPEFAVNGQTDETGAPLVFSVLKYHHRDVNGRPNVYTRSQHLHRYDPSFEPLSEYAVAVVKALGLKRCPFHMEIRFDPIKGPCLVEIAARPVGNQIVQLMRDAHGHSFEPLRIACHHYLSAAPRTPPLLNWANYDRIQAINVDGITSKTGMIAEIGDIREVEASPFFKRWVVEPEVGRTLEATKDLLSQPFSFHLVTSDAEVNLMAEADRLDAKVELFTTDAPFAKRLWAYLIIWNKRLRMRWELVRFRKTLEKTES